MLAFSPPFGTAFECGRRGGRSALPLRCRAALQGATPAALASDSRQGAVRESSRRELLLSAAILLASGMSRPAAARQDANAPAVADVDNSLSAKEAIYIPFVARSKLFSLSRPTTWAIASVSVRTCFAWKGIARMGTVGTWRLFVPAHAAFPLLLQDRSVSLLAPPLGGIELLCLAGDFNTIDTLSVSRLTLPPGAAAFRAASLVDSLIADKRLSGSTLRFSSEGTRDVGTSPSARYVAFDYTVETCRGTVTEENGGVLSCVSAQDGSLLQTVIRRATCVAAVDAAVAGKDGEPVTALLLIASSPAARWGDTEETLRAICASFKAFSDVSVTTAH